MSEREFRLEGWHAGVFGVAVVVVMVIASALGAPPFDDSPTPGAEQGTPGPVVPGQAAPGGVGSAAAQPLAPGGDPLRKQKGTALPAPATTCVPQSSDVEFTVLSFNTYSARRLSQARMTQVAREIAAADADVVLLQEVSGNRNGSSLADQADFYGRLLGMEAVFGANEYRGPGEYGVATLSRFPIVGQANYRLPYVADGNRRNHRRGLLHTQVRIDETVVSVYNTHLQPGYPGLRVRQARAMTAAVAADPLPAVVGGDLNSSPGSAALSVARSRLRDAWLDAGTGLGLTHPVRAPRSRIDYLLYTEPLRARDARTLGSAISDHRAVRATFRLEADGEPVCLPLFDQPLDQQEDD